ncbi:MAG TPA: Spy/CpxP family protein refolding chaperone [Vicinamibacterales bacterium]|jgi:protein CpxP
MTTRFKTSLAAGIAVLTIATAAPVLVAVNAEQRGPGPGFGGPPPGGPGGPGMRGPGGPMGFGPGFRELDLTDDQRAQMRAIAESHRDEFKAAGDKSRAAHESMQALLEAETLDEAAIRAKSVEVAAAEADVMILNAKVRRESMQILTSEQQAKLKELRESRGARQRKPGRH